MHRALRTVFICMLLLLVPSYAAMGDVKKKMVVVVLNSLSFNDFMKCSDIKALAGNGCIGLMSSRSNGRDNYYKPYMTLGSGEKAEVPFSCIENFTACNDIIDEYSRITNGACVKGNILNLSINRLIDVNSKTFYNASPGKLGSILRRYGVITCFIGGFYYKDRIKSPAFFIAMDNMGVADCGNIDGVFQNSYIDKTRLMESFEAYLNTADFLVIELGDIEGAYATRSMYSNEAYHNDRDRIIGDSGKIIGEISKKIDYSNTLLCIVSPYSEDSNSRREVLSPVIFYDGGKSRGILISDTTRRDGLVSALDFAPSVLKCFNIDDGTFVGYPVRWKTVNGNIEYITQLDRSIYNTSASRGPVSKGYAVSIIGVLIFFLFVKKKSLALFMMKALMIVPPALLLEGIFKFERTAEKVAFVSCLSLLLAYTLDKAFKNDLYCILSICLLNICALSFDTCFGQGMQKCSILGYDPIIGARFYGMGNEFMGVIVGSMLICCGCALEGHPRLLIAAACFMGLLCMVIGLPMLGSNNGGFITASAGFAFFILLEKGYKIKKSGLYAILLCAVSLLILIIVDISLKGGGSHLGRMFTMMKASGFSIGINIIRRKAEMSLRLIRFTIWSRVLIALIIVSSAVSLKPGGHIREFFMHFPHLKNAWISSVGASILAILTNDSGIVASAFIMLYAVFGGIILSLRNEVRD